MRIFSCFISGDEMVSDGFTMKLIENDAVWEITCAMVDKTDEEVDDEGGVASTKKTKVIDVVDKFNYKETSFDKDQFKAYLKEYMKRVKERLEKKKKDKEAMDKFMKSVFAFITKVMKDFEEYRFYTGESMDPEGTIALLRWIEETPTIYIFADGLDETRV